MPELCVELCDMESSRMQMPGSWIFATYIFKNKLKSFKLRRIYHYKGKSIFSKPKILAWTQQQYSTGVKLIFKPSLFILYTMD